MIADRECERCGKRYPDDAKECIYCKDLTDADLQKTKTIVDEIKKHNKGLNLIFLYLFFIVALVVVSLYLS